METVETVANRSGEAHTRLKPGARLKSGAGRDLGRTSQHAGEKSGLSRIYAVGREINHEWTRINTNRDEGRRTQNTW